MKLKHIIVWLFIVCFWAITIDAQDFEANYDESKIPEYELPELLKLTDHQKVINQNQWMQERRPEILQLFETQVYGKAPEKPEKIEYEIISIHNDALGGKAIQKIIQVYLISKSQKIKMDVLIYLPKNKKKSVPFFLGLNFYGNHTTINDSNIPLARGWVSNNKDFGITENKATELSRGVRVSRWPYEMIVKRGYGIATVYYGDITPDKVDSFDEGIHSKFPGLKSKSSWGAIAAWSWGLTRVMDYFYQDDDVDENRICVFGHSRLGKTALWAGAIDERFAMVYSNNSGCGGAALSRRKIGETVRRINMVFPHWFCKNFRMYNDNENQLPVDQHMLIALAAPRPVYVTSATEDLWADPKGEFLSAKYASLVYELFDKKGLTEDEMPYPDQSVGHTIGYHIRTGKHDITAFDWQMVLAFADRYLK